MKVEHSIAHIHTYNGLAESFIKKNKKMNVQPMIMRTNLLIYIWGYAILYATTLFRIRSIIYHTYSPMQLVLGHESNISCL